MDPNAVDNTFTMDGVAPLFLRLRQDGALGFQDQPMSAESFCLRLDSVLNAVGLNPVVAGLVLHGTPYSFRQGTVTDLRPLLGNSGTQKFMGHKQGGAILASLYDQAGKRHDLAGLLNKETLDNIVRISAGDTPALLQGAMKQANQERETNTTTIRSLTDTDQVLQAIDYDIRVVEDALSCGSDRWLELASLKGSPFRKVSCAANRFSLPA
jgi:hypothetical protein